MSDEINDIYIRAFNHAYLIAKYKSELARNILHTKNNGIYIQGFKDGRDQFNKDQMQSRLKEIESIKSREDRDQEK
ncbi:MAG: hypothetical protein AAF489_03640 [Bacteroidota bacterium]